MIVECHSRRVAPEPVTRRFCLGFDWDETGAARNIMRNWRLTLMMLVAVMGSGCVVFTPPQTSVSSGDLQRMHPGQWCRVTLPNRRWGWDKKIQTVYSGQIQQVNEDSLTLTDVTKQSLVTSPIRNSLPYSSRLFKVTGVRRQLGSGELTLLREEIENVEPISAELAKELNAPVFDRVVYDSNDAQRDK
jgi:hypothetical protein